MSGSFYTGWTISEGERALLLDLFPPAYPDVIAHHVTLAFGVPEDAPLRPAASGWVVGVADDGAGVQALIFEIDGTTKRPDGKTFHMTLSIDRSKGAKPFHSNRVIAEKGYTPVEPVPVFLEPGRFSTT